MLSGYLRNGAVLTPTQVALQSKVTSAEALRSQVYGMVQQAWTPALSRLRQEDCFKFKSSLSYTLRSRPAWLQSKTMH